MIEALWTVAALLGVGIIANGFHSYVQLEKLGQSFSDFMERFKKLEEKVEGLFTVKSGRRK